ncbi:hypothetical protein PFISCL1PPCAC_26802 [Pristionchus fissidentatus]|uniref:F-box domain-containing protein n=1 Tax=Pristionchus fissidentatus TaxID=1538716 RepID=A0AAV5WXY6_9BILA|nr:hypothetical protein PFISCL1PPCAC_26802 [Pristionchus fissidentatus]
MSYFTTIICLIGRIKVRFAKTAVLFGDLDREEIQLALSSGDETWSESSYGVTDDESDEESETEVIRQRVEQPSELMNLPPEVLLRIIDYAKSGYFGYATLKQTSRLFYNLMHAHTDNPTNVPPVEIMRFQGIGKKKMTVIVDVLSENHHYFFKLKSLNPEGVRGFENRHNFVRETFYSYIISSWLVVSHKFTVDLTDAIFFDQLKRAITTIRKVEVLEMSEDGMKIVNSFLGEQQEIAHISINYTELNQEESEKLLDEIRKRSTKKVQIRVVNATMDDPESFLLRLAALVDAIGIYQEGKNEELTGTNYMFGLRDGD